ncbi:MAG: hypothetical protein Kapaf2KO_13200 [Candidatus Kapaibacteriales bacterium]
MKHLYFLLTTIGFFLQASPSAYSGNWELAAETHPESIWARELLNQNDTLYSVNFSSDTLRILRSLDKGRNWNQIAISRTSRDHDPSLYSTRSASMTDGMIFIYGFDEYFVVAKYDTWANTGKIQYVGDASDGHLIERGAMLDRERGLIFSRLSGKIYETDDGWETYETYTSDTLNFFGDEDPQFFNDSLIIFYGYSRYSDLNSFSVFNINQRKWKVISNVSQVSTLPIGYEKVNEFLHYVSGKESQTKTGRTNDHILRSRDGGRTWESLFNKDVWSPAYRLNDIEFIDERNGVAIGSGFKVYSTNDGGANWTIDTLDHEFLYPTSVYGPLGWNTTTIGDDIYGLTTDDSELYKWNDKNFFNRNYPVIQSASLNSPKNKSSIAEDSIFFKWKEVNGATDYVLQVCEREDFNLWDTTYTNLWLKETSVSLPKYQTDKKLYWRILSVMGSVVRSSEVREFRILDEVAELEAPTIIGCENSFLEEPYPFPDLIEIEWNAVNGANAYDYSITGYFSQSTILETKRTTELKTSIDSLPVGMYNICITSVDTNTNRKSDTSCVCSFVRSYSTPVFSTEDCGRTLSENDTIFWRSGEESPGEYIFQIVSDSTFQSGGIASEPVFYAFYPLEKIELKPFTKYYYRVQAIKHFQQPILEKYGSPWSEICSFTTDDLGSVENIEPSELGYRLSNGTIYLENIHPEATLQLHDLSGRVLMSRTGNQLDVSGITRGVYFIVIDGEKVVKVQL